MNLFFTSKKRRSLRCVFLVGGETGIFALAFRQIAKSSLVLGWRPNLPRRFVRRSFARFVFRLNSRLASNLFESFISKQIKYQYFVLVFYLCGETGIRTLGTFRYTHFPGVRTRPLCDLSKSDFNRLIFYSLFNFLAINVAKPSILSPLEST